MTETHGMGANSIVMRRPDGTAMTRKEVIKKRRGAFKWLPVLCSNDLVHGSWWMVVGSFGCTIFAIIPLIQQYESFYKSHDDMLPAVDFKITWALLIFSGFFFTLGSFAFVRAFEEPPRRALLYWNKHFRTDELLGAWLFLFGTVPAVPYALVYFIIDPSFTYIGLLSSSGVFVLGTVVFVLACYPTDKNHKNIVLPWCLRICGARIWVVKHLANDWLAGTWFFLWANGIFTFFSFLLFFIAVYTGDPNQIFMWCSSAMNSLFFLVGSFYYVSGSYPHAQQFYYAVDRGVGNTLTYDAPANLPDYSDPSDELEVDSLFFSTPSKQRKSHPHAGAHGADVESSSAYTHVNGNGNDSREDGFNVVSPMHLNESNAAALRAPLDPSGASAHTTHSAPKPPSVPVPSSLPVPVIAPIPKPVLTHEIDENFDDDDDEVDGQDSTSGRTVTVTSPTSSLTDSNRISVPSYAPPPIPTSNSKV